MGKVVVAVERCVLYQLVDMFLLSKMALLALQSANGALLYLQVCCTASSGCNIYWGFEKHFGTSTIQCSCHSCERCVVAGGRYICTAV